MTACYSAFVWLCHRHSDSFPVAAPTPTGILRPGSCRAPQSCPLLPRQGPRPTIPFQNSREAALNKTTSVWVFSEPPPCPTWSQTQGCFPCALRKAVPPAFPSPGVPSPSAASRPGVHPEGKRHRGCRSWAGIQDTVVARNSQHLLPSLGLSFSCGGLAFALEEFPRNLQDSRPVTRKPRCAQLTHRCSQCSLRPYRVRGRGASCCQAPLLLSWSRRFAGGGSWGLLGAL